MAPRGRGGIRIPIITEFDDKAIKSFASQVEKLGKGFTRNLTAPIFAVGGAFAFFVKGAIEAEKQQFRLSQILKTTNAGTDEQIKLLLKQASALEKSTVVSKENVIATQAQLATFDLQASTIAKLTPAILDYVLAEKGATATTQDFQSMTNSLAQALNGQFGGLTRVGFVLDDTTKKLISNGTEAERVEAIVDVLGSTYAGFAEALVNTPEGQLIMLQKEFRDLRDEIGTALLPVMGDLVSMIKTDLVPIVKNVSAFIQVLATRFTNLDTETKKQIVAFILILAAIGPVLIVVASLIRAVLLLSKVFGILGLAIVKIPLAIILIIGSIRMANSEQAKLAKDTRTIWSFIFQVTKEGVIGSAHLLDMYVNSLSAVGATADFMQQKLNNAFRIVGGLPAIPIKSLQEFIEENKNTIDTSSKVESAMNKLGNGIKSTFDGIQKDLEGFSKISEETAKTSAELEAEIKALQKVIPPTGEAAEKTAAKTAKLKEALKLLKAEIVKIKTEAVEALKSSLSEAERKLEQARDKFNSFKDAISGSISGIINFGKAAENENFLAGLTEQAEAATNFADRVKTLIQMGLSEAAIQEVLKAGNEAGLSIADQIISGGSTVVNQVNTLVASVTSVAEQVGIFGAEAFFQAGVVQGQALVEGILSELRKAQAELIAAQQAATSGGTIPQFGKRASSLFEDISNIAGNKQRNRALDSFQASLTKSGRGISEGNAANIRKRFKLADGGIVMGPTNALIGEAGPEAVIPLSGANSARSALGSTINITVNAGLGTDGTLVGRQIVEAIKRYERSSGPQFVRA